MPHLFWVLLPWDVLPSFLQHRCLATPQSCGCASNNHVDWSCPLGAPRTPESMRVGGKRIDDLREAVCAGDATKAMLTRSMREEGIKCTSAFLSMPSYFDVTKDVIFEPLHQLLLNAAKDGPTRWFSATGGEKKEYFVPGVVDSWRSVVEERYKQMTFPRHFRSCEMVFTKPNELIGEQ